MHRWGTSSVQALAFVASLCGATLASDAVPFKLGEKLTFSIKYEFVKAGEATLEVKEITQCGNQSDCFRLVSEAKSTMPFSLVFEVRDRVESFLQVDSLYTLKYVKTLKEGNFEAYEAVDFDQVGHKAVYPDGKSIEIPPKVQDVLSSLYYIRTMDLEVGRSVFINNHADEKNYPLEVKVLRIEKIKVPAGTYECFVLEPVLRASGIFQHKGKLTVWMSTDPSGSP